MKVYCINLAERFLKWTDTQQEFKDKEFELIRVDAMKTRKGWVGCRESHFKAMEQAPGEVFMICEDDILFLPDAMENLNKAFNQLPDNWDLLYLGATLNEPLKRYSDNLFELKKAWALHGVIYNGRMVADFVLSNRDNIRKIDVFFADIVQEGFKCYLTYPMVATQRPGYSDIINSDTNYDMITERYKMYTK
jgi:GR25 family glycosyltransferase involved in LPS biosynthesis